ncbi:MAG: diphthine--ammonia ligase [bacterium]
MDAICSLSGGKDSCLALYKAIKEGHKIKCLLNFISRGFKRCCFHGIEAGLMSLQANCLGIPLVQKEVSPDMEEYEREFKSAVSGIKEINAMVFGDIYLNEHKEWVERVCSDLGITPIEPLWNSPPESLIEEFIDLGFKAIVVSCQADKFGKDFIGNKVDRDFLSYLKEKNICPAGENGEFHTLVIDDPIFKRRIEIIESEPVLKEGFWKHWFLDIKKYR